MRRQLGTASKTSKALCFCAWILLLLCPPLHAETVTLTLDALIRTALGTNPILRASEEQCQASRSRITQVRSAYLPHVTVKGLGGYEYWWDSTPSDDKVVLGDVSAKQLIYDFGKTGGAIHAQQHESAATDELLDARINDIIFEVRRAYYDILEKRAVVEVCRDSVKILRNHLERTRGYYNADLRNAVDLTTAEVKLSEGRYELVRSKSALKLAKVKLEKVLGTSPNAGDYKVSVEPVEIRDFARELPPVPDELEPLILQALEVRHELRSMKARMKAAKSLVRSARGEYWPSLNAVISYTKWDTDLTLQAFRDNWKTSVNVQWEVFSGLETRGKVAEANHNMALLESLFREKELLVIEEVTESYLSARDNAESLGVATDTLGLARENFSLARERYDAGLGSKTEYDDALINYNTAQIEVARSYFACLTALARIAWATGTPLGAGIAP